MGLPHLEWGPGQGCVSVSLILLSCVLFWCGGAVHLILRSFSEENYSIHSCCLWEQVSLGSSYSAILKPLPVFSSSEKPKLTIEFEFWASGKLYSENIKIVSLTSNLPPSYDKNRHQQTFRYNSGPCIWNKTLYMYLIGDNIYAFCLLKRKYKINKRYRIILLLTNSR